MRFGPRLLLAVLALALSACGGLSVRVEHLAPPKALKSENLASLQALYVVLVGPPPDPSEEPAGARRGVEAEEEEPRRFDTLSRAVTRNEARAMLDQALTVLQGSRSAVVAYQLQASSRAPALADAVGAKAVLWLVPSKLEGDKTEEMEQLYDKAGVQRGTREVYRMRGRFEMAWRLADASSGDLLGQGRFTTVEESTETLARELERWLDSRPGLLRDWTDQLKTHLLPHPVEVQREVAKGASERMTQAYEAASGGDWARAETLWREEWAAAKSPDAAFDLALAAEKAGRWDEARDLYREAAAAEGELAEKARRHAAEIDRMAGVAALQAGAGSAWFDEPLSVAAFTGPADMPEEALRQLRERAAELLARKGLKVLPLQESEGDPAPARVLQGEVLAYRAPDDGSARLVRLRLRLLDLSGRRLWEGSGLSERSYELGEAAGEEDQARLAAAALQKEAALALVDALEPFPSRPGSGSASARPMRGRPARRP